MLKNTPVEFFEGIREILSKNAKIAYDILYSTPGLFPVRPKGAMYMMVGKWLLSFVQFLMRFLVFNWIVKITTRRRLHVFVCSLVKRFYYLLKLNQFSLLANV